MIGQMTATAVDKQELAPGIFKMRLFAPVIAREAVPGQFVHIKCDDHRDFILRRPFSVHQVIGDSIEILFNRIGPGTEWLASLALKSTIDIIGPLGHGFDITGSSGSVLLVAGGMGIAPLVFTAARLVEKNIKIFALIGAADNQRLLDYMDLKRLTRRITATTEDGSRGTKGRVTDVLDDVIRENLPERVFACGPRGMLAQVAAITARRGVPCQVALEELMACGVGVCLSCVTRTKTGYKKVCSDGPVFDSDEIVW